MTAAINDEVTISEGDCVTLRYPILDSSGNAVSFVAPTGIWALFPYPVYVDGHLPVFTKSVTLSQSGGIWTGTVELVEADTEDVEGLECGRHYIELRVKDSDSDSQTVATGILTILPTGVRQPEQPEG